MNQPPNRKWAYAILERVKRGDRKDLSPAAIKIAEEAVKLDRLGTVTEQAKEAA